MLFIGDRVKAKKGLEVSEEYHNMIPNKIYTIIDFQGGWAYFKETGMYKSYYKDRLELVPKMRNIPTEDV